MRIVLAVALALVPLGCTGGSGDDEPDGGSATSAPAIEPEPAAVPDGDAPADGRARLVLGSSLDLTLVVERCHRDLAAQPDGEVPSEQVTVVARGTGPGGEPVMVDVRRFRSQGASPTITDTVRVVEGPEDAPRRVLEAQRFEVDGLVTDPRDPDADDPLLRVTDREVHARGVFAPPGAFADDGGLVEGVLAISCTG